MLPFHLLSSQGRKVVSLELQSYINLIAGTNWPIFFSTLKHKAWKQIYWQIITHNYSFSLGSQGGPINSLTVQPTPVIPGSASTDYPGSSTTPIVDGEWHAGGKDVILPRDEYLVRTVLASNMTLLHNRIEDFKTSMEHNLTSLYRNAYEHRR